MSIKSLGNIIFELAFMILFIFACSFEAEASVLQKGKIELANNIFHVLAIIVLLMIAACIVSAAVIYLSGMKKEKMRLISKGCLNNQYQLKKEKTGLQLF